MLKILKESLKTCPVVKKGDYDYFVHPITDGVPEIAPGLLDEISTQIMKIANPNYDKIVTAEAMGIPIGTALSLKTGKPLVVIRKVPYHFPKEIPIRQVTGYSKSDMYINGIEKGDKVLIVDDVISTGGTLSAIIQALRNIDAKIADIVIVIEKGDAKKKVEEKYKIKIKALTKVEMVKGKVVVLW